jgi:hypothetical protein
MPPLRGRVSAYCVAATREGLGTNEDTPYAFLRRETMRIIVRCLSCPPLPANFASPAAAAVVSDDADDAGEENEQINRRFHRRRVRADGLPCCWCVSGGARCLFVVVASHRLQARENSCSNTNCGEKMCVGGEGRGGGAHSPTARLHRFACS